jgi:hypothetical protein
VLLTVLAAAAARRWDVVARLGYALRLVNRIAERTIATTPAPVVLIRRPLWARPLLSTWNRVLAMLAATIRRAVGSGFVRRRDVTRRVLAPPGPCLRRAPCRPRAPERARWALAA